MLQYSDSISCPHGIQNQYFNFDQSQHNCFTDQLNIDDSVRTEFQKMDIKQKWIGSAGNEAKQKQKSKIIQKSKSKSKFQGSKYHKHQLSIFKEAQSLFIPFTKLAKLEELSEIKEHSKSSRVRNEKSIIQKRLKEAKSKAIEEYFGKEIQHENKPVVAKPLNLPTKIKRSLSQIKPYKMFSKISDSPVHNTPIIPKSKYSRIRQLHFPALKPNPNMFKKVPNKNKNNRNSPGVQLSKLSQHKQLSIHKNSRVQSSKDPKIYSIFKKSKSITKSTKPLIVYNKEPYHKQKQKQKHNLNLNVKLKLKTQESKYTIDQIQDQIDVLNQTLTEIRTLNEIENKTNRLFSQRFNYSSLLIDLEYHNLLNQKRRKKE